MLGRDHAFAAAAFALRIRSRTIVISGQKPITAPAIISGSAIGGFKKIKSDP